MADVTGRWPRAEDAARGARARASWGENLVTALLATVTAIGGTLDAWAHANLGLQETFFTPWHAVLYTGFVASSAWIALLVVRRSERGWRGLAAVPVGYGLGIVGVLTFAAGGLFDLGWHSVFGIEVGIEPLLSPPHLLLGLGGLLLESSPLRAMWAEAGSPRAPGLRALFPAVLSAALVAGDISFFLMWASPFLQIFPAEEIGAAIAAVLITNVIYIGTLLLLLRRWQLPFGAATFLFCFNAALTSAIVGFRTWPTLLAALAGGVAADLLIHRLQPSPHRPVALRAFAGLTSAALWSAYILIVWLIGALDWSVPLWSGVIALAAGGSVAFALLTAPPPLPAADPPQPAPLPEPVHSSR
ncbi:MAG: hypothetical protein ACRD0K_27225 [Egibacteraceae bacterium]